MYELFAKFNLRCKKQQTGFSAEENQTDFGSRFLKNILPYALSVFCGTAIAFICAGLYYFLLFIQNFALGNEENFSFESCKKNFPQIFVSSAVAAAVWALLQHYCGKIKSVSDAVKGEKLPFFKTAVHIFAQIYVSGSGLSVGREAAARQAGTLAGQTFARYLPLSKREAELTVACAAAAGFAGVYGSAAAGIFFALEILLSKIDLKAIIVCFLTCFSTSAGTGFFIKDDKPLFELENPCFSQSFAIFSLICAPLFGFVGAAFRETVKKAARRRAKGARILLFLPAAGLLTAIIAHIMPQISGNGIFAVRFSLLSVRENAVAILFATAIVKFVLTCLTLRSGAYGGTIMPAIAVGACAGGCLAGVLANIFPYMHFSASLFVLLGSCIVLSVSQKAAFMSVFLIFELFKAPAALFFPILLCCFLACETDKLLFGNINRKLRQKTNMTDSATSF